MKVQCSGCKAAFQINDSKIPEKGAYAICPKCKTRFYIKKESRKPKKENIKKK
ncbi:MAG: zinc-ribbon domain-containing protein [Deltaproteobacteria bacterium]|nr:zinc-ribbon domain-containing protein [Deltaproteobacteria bacterium]